MMSNSAIWTEARRHPLKMWMRYKQRWWLVSNLGNFFQATELWSGKKTSLWRLYQSILRARSRIYLSLTSFKFWLLSDDLVNLMVFSFKQLMHFSRSVDSPICLRWSILKLLLALKTKRSIAKLFQPQLLEETCVINHLSNSQSLWHKITSKQARILKLDFKVFPFTSTFALKWWTSSILSGLDRC